MNNKENFLELLKIDKRFGGVHALDNISFAFDSGEVHAIVGENGAGKSTLMKVLAGACQPDSGKIKMRGEVIEFNNPRDSRAAGISIIYQEFYKFPALSVLANIFAGQEKNKYGFLQEKDMRERALEVLELMGAHVDLDATVKYLSVADQQLTEIAKALVYDGELVIMDEPNSALTYKETQSLFEIIRRLKAQGITILYVSHRLEDVFNISDRITVLRDGNYIGTWQKDKTDIPFIISQMIGRTLTESYSTSVGESNPEKILEVRGLSKEGGINSIDFFLRRGEVLGFVGLEGSGIRELFHILFGLDKAGFGEIHYLGEKVNIGFSSDAINLGWGLIPANRRDHGLFMRWSVKENLSVVIYKRMMNWLGLLKNREMENIATKFINKLNITTDSPDKLVFNLSGGNQQKVVLCKWLATEPSLLILDDPTRGIDVGAKNEVYNQINELSTQGISILLYSSEIDEVLGLSHRILVMRQGRIIKEFVRGDANKEQVMQFVSGDVGKKQPEIQ